MDKFSWLNIRDDLLVTMGARAAYMHDKDLIKLPSGVEGERELSAFVVTTVNKYIFSPGLFDMNFDEYIETALTEKYGVSEKEPTAEVKPYTDDGKFEKLGEEVWAMIDELKRYAHRDLGFVDSGTYAVYKALQYLEEQVVNLNKRIK